MNKLAKLEIPLTAAKGESLDSLLCKQVEALSAFRLEFYEAMGKDLCDSGDELQVRLNRGGSTSLSRKLAKYIWTISGLFMESQAFQEVS